MMLDALYEADTFARTMALTALDRTMLVEAGAGSGKTSVLAGRVTSLLAAGHAPGSIAAITFTELAAGELRERICAFVAEVAGGHVRADLATAFPGGPSTAQKQALILAGGSLDQLVCTTIHGFCQVLLRPYPVEAGMDPGASIMDPNAAKSLFAETLDFWLRERLSVPRQADDLLVALYLRDAGKTGTLLKTLGAQLLQHRGAQVAMTDRLAQPLEAMAVAVAAFRAFLGEARCSEPETLVIVQELELLLQAGPLPASPEPDMLIHLLEFRAPASCSKADGGFAAYQKAGKWKEAAKASLSTMAAKDLSIRAANCYGACKEAHEAARSYAAGRILHLLAGELREVIALFQRAKRNAGLIDFDDLLVKARDLLVAQPQVQVALGRRFAAVLVDEFQDTDPLQCEILWRLCGLPGAAGTSWKDWSLRPGALFLVGDPKQAIYRFRGADVACYVEARTRLLAADATARLVIGQNFRSVSGILDWVNERFAGPLSHPAQPGFEVLFTRVAAADGRPAIAALPVDDGANANSARTRDAEADAVASFCARIIGALPVRGKDGPRACRPDDIALLAPTGTDLWRYERALEAQGIAVSTQAGKGFFRRQEVQDLIALTRVLADSRDTLAFGALLRGPLVGLTEEHLLDAVAGLPEQGPDLPRLSLWTPIEQVPNLLLRETLATLQTLARQAHRTTPYVLLCQAVEEMQVRAQLRRRHDRTAERALANLDLFLEAARPFDVRGLAAFAATMRQQWTDAQQAMEGRPDTEQQSVSLVTMHSSKGLEWPVVIPINTATSITKRTDMALNADGILHLPVFGCHGPGAKAALDAERAELDRETNRLWYVATTRARDLLVMPIPSSGVGKGSWMGAMPFALEQLPLFDADGLSEALLHRTEELANRQDRARFETEAALIAARTQRIRRLTPHLAETGDNAPAGDVVRSLANDDSDVPAMLPRGSLARGLILHKLLEEVLTGEVGANTTALQVRAAQLATELADAPGVAIIDPLELAGSVLRGLAVPAVQAIRDRLIAECWVASSVVGTEAEQVTLGIADAVALDAAGRINVVVDWKSDVAPNEAIIRQYLTQVRTYMEATGADHGLLVFLTSGQVVTVTREATA